MKMQTTMAMRKKMTTMTRKTKAMRKMTTMRKTKAMRKMTTKRKTKRRNNSRFLKMGSGKTG